MKPKSEQTALDLDHLPEHREHVPAYVRETREEAVRQYPNEGVLQSPQSPPAEPPAAESPEVQDSPFMDFSPSAEEKPEVNQYLFQPEEPRAAGREQFFAESATVEEPSRVPPLYPIGQMHGTYIFAQNDRGLYIIDQHAAQERIKYEYFREKVGQVESELQEMLIPLTFEYSTDDYIKIDEYKGELEKVGYFWSSST